MLPFWSPCHAIFKTVFFSTLALLFLLLVLLELNGHFYNVNLTTKIADLRKPAGTAGGAGEHFGLLGNILDLI